MKIYTDMTKLRKFYKLEYGKPVFKQASTNIESGNIYKIEDNVKFYIGLTTGNIEKRLAEHST